MVRLWLGLLTLLLMKDLVMVVGFQAKHKMEKSKILKSPAQRSSRDISSHISPSGRVQPRLEAEDFRPHLQLPQGFDPGTAEQQEDGQLCVFKKLSLEGLSAVLWSGLQSVMLSLCQVLRRSQCSSVSTGWTPSATPPTSPSTLPPQRLVTIKY